MKSLYYITFFMLTYIELINRKTLWGFLYLYLCTYLWTLFTFLTQNIFELVRRLSTLCAWCKNDMTEQTLNDGKKKVQVPTNSTFFVLFFHHQIIRDTLSCHWHCIQYDVMLIRKSFYLFYLIDWSSWDVKARRYFLVCFKWNLR